MAQTVMRRSLSPLADAYRAEIDRLGAEHAIAIEYVDRATGRAWRKPRRVRIGAPSTPARYATALHELGHLITTRRAHRLTRELDAWIWARAHGAYWSDECDQECRRALATYVAWARRRTGVRRDGIAPIRAFVLSLLP